MALHNFRSGREALEGTYLALLDEPQVEVEVEGRHQFEGAGRGGEHGGRQVHARDDGHLHVPHLEGLEGFEWIELIESSIEGLGVGVKGHCGARGGATAGSMGSRHGRVPVVYMYIHIIIIGAGVRTHPGPDLCCGRRLLLLLLLPPSLRRRRAVVPVVVRGAKHGYCCLCGWGVGGVGGWVS